MVNKDGTPGGIITAKPLPAILVGGPPHAGKSTLIYNLTRELRRRGIPHYVFRANPDIEGDWFLQGNLTTVRQIQLRVWDYRHWTEIFRAFVCRDLALRYLPLIVDLGGLPRVEDTCIFRVCTHSILLLKDEDGEATRIWRHFAATNGLLPLADLRSQQEGEDQPIAVKPVITGTIITGLERGASMDGPVFRALLERICQLFSSFLPEELEQFHLDQLHLEYVVHLPHELQVLSPGSNGIWTNDLLQPLLARHPAQTAMAVYGRAPNWVYGALALHARAQPFHQFDARIGWVTPPILQVGALRPSSEPPISIKEGQDSDAYVILIHPVHDYLDYRQADQLVFPAPPSRQGVIVSGKLPLWLFTALARFYAAHGASWIALNDACNNQPIVVYSQVAAHPIGEILPELPEL